MSVRALFRVLNVTDHIDIKTVELVPTYQTRDGVQCEENKAFWETTPSGRMEMTVAKDAECLELFKPGVYVYLDFDDALGTTEWFIDSIDIRGQYPQFEVKLYPAPCKNRTEINGWSHPAGNRWLFGRHYAKAELRMSINNLKCYDFFKIEPGVTRKVMVSFSGA